MKDYSSELIEKKGRPALELEWLSLDEMTKSLVDLLEGLAWILFRREIVITSMIRLDHPLHSTGRCVDIDVDEENAYDGLAPGEALAIRETINEIFTYDPSRPKKHAIIYGDNDAEGKHWNHIHLQACWANRTKLRREELKIWVAKLIAHAETLT